MAPYRSIIKGPGCYRPRPLQHPEGVGQEDMARSVSPLVSTSSGAKFGYDWLIFSLRSCFKCIGLVEV